MLVKDGGAAAAVPILEDVLRQLRLHPRDESNVRFAQAYLDDAYDQVGRTAECQGVGDRGEISIEHYPIKRGHPSD